MRVGVVKFASCDGCQLAFLDLGPALLDIGARFSIVEFGEASSDRSPDGPFDILFVEGSISTADQLRHIRHLRDRDDAAGDHRRLRHERRHPGPARLGRQRRRHRGLSSRRSTRTPSTSTRWPPRRPSPTTSRSTPSCAAAPSTPRQLVELLTATAIGRRPQLPSEAVCVECKRAGRVCVMVARGEPCLGPIISTGCGALCPGLARGCYGCFGPRESANGESLAAWFRGSLGLPTSASRRGSPASRPGRRRCAQVIDAAGGPPGMRAAAARQRQRRARHRCRRSAA